MVKSFSVTELTMGQINELSKTLQKKQSEIIREAIDGYHYAKIGQRFEEMESQPQTVIGEAVPETNVL